MNYLIIIHILSYVQYYIFVSFFTFSVLGGFVIITYKAVAMQVFVCITIIEYWLDSKRIFSCNILVGLLVTLGIIPYREEYSCFSLVLMTLILNKPHHLRRIQIMGNVIVSNWGFGIRLLTHKWVIAWTPVIW